jgi:8-oxo-dGTP pyrophosphatase MutT (NUDIX family)
MKELPDESIVITQQLREKLRQFAFLTPAANIEAFIALTADPHAFARSRLSAHFTASAWLVSADGARALLMHHAKLGCWLQPGGHADGDPDLARVALREAEEETGLAGLRVLPDIFDVDCHAIPARGDEPEHLHYDVRYVVHAEASEQAVANEESLALAWVPVTVIAQDAAYDPSLQRMARRWLARYGS